MSSLFQQLALRKSSPAEAMVCEGERLSFAALYERVLRVAKGLSATFVALPEGSRVALLFWNQSEFFISFLALRLLGFVPVPMNLLMPSEDIAYVFKHAGVAAVVACEELALESIKKQGLSLDKFALPKVLCQQTLLTKLLVPSLEGFYTGKESLEALEAWAESLPFDAEALACLVYTSGTTGQPKGVMISESVMLAAMEGFQAVLGFEAESHRFLLGIPLFHCYGLLCGLYGLSLGACIHFVPKFQPKRLVQVLEQEAITILPLVPTMFTFILQQAKRLKKEHPDAKPFPQLQYCISGGMALSAALLDDIHTVLQADVMEGYGLTETMAAVAVNSPAQGPLAGSVGRVVGSGTVRLVDPETNALLQGVGDEGEIQFQGSNLMIGYYNAPDATREVMTPDGWFRTGDLGCFDAAGNLFISGGRLKDLIIRAGENIAPLKIERCLAQHPNVGEVACIPKQDARLGEAILACIEPKAGSVDVLDDAALQAFTAELKGLCGANLPASYVPDAFWITDTLPKGPTGKLNKKQLKATLSAGEG